MPCSVRDGDQGPLGPGMSHASPGWQGPGQGLSNLTLDTEAFSSTGWPCSPTARLLLGTVVEFPPNHLHLKTCLKAKGKQILFET